MANDDEHRAAAAGRAEVAALRREHAGYALYGRQDRAAEVAAVLKSMGEPLEDTAAAAPRDRAVPKRRAS